MTRPRRPTRPHDPAFEPGAIRSLTKREYLSALCLGGILAQKECWENLTDAAELAIAATDRLIEALNREIES